MKIKETEHYKQAQKVLNVIYNKLKCAEIEVAKDRHNNHHVIAIVKGKVYSLYCSGFNKDIEIAELTLHSVVEQEQKYSIDEAIKFIKEKQEV